MRYWRLLIGLCLALVLPVQLLAMDYNGRVVDEKGQALMYATVYVQSAPQIGTATNVDGYFTLQSDSLSPDAMIMISSLGYQTLSLPLSVFSDTFYTVQLAEQPILLSSSYVDAKKTRQSKRKKKAGLLYVVYKQMLEQSPKEPVQYHVVSDIKMNARQAAWGMEQLVASVVEIPSKSIEQPDSIQYLGLSCKRYCDPVVRRHVDQIYKEDTDKQRKQFATAIDSGIIVHRKMWEMSQMDKTVFLDLSDELRRWDISQPDSRHMLFTYARKRVYYLGIVQVEEKHYLLVDNDATLQTYACDLNIKIFLPISVKVKDADLSWVNLLNMGDEQIQKFRFKKANMHIRFETHYRLSEGLLLPTDKTMHVNAQLEDNKGNVLPCEIWSKQQVVATQTRGVIPKSYYRKGHRVTRQIVPIY